MFGKIKDKLKNLFSKSEEVIEEPLEEELSEEEKKQLESEESEAPQEIGESGEESRDEEVEEVPEEIETKDLEEDSQETGELEVGNSDEEVKEEEISAEVSEEKEEIIEEKEEPPLPPQAPEEEEKTKVASPEVPQELLEKEEEPVETKEEKVDEDIPDEKEVEEVFKETSESGDESGGDKEHKEDIVEKETVEEIPLPPEAPKEEEPLSPEPSQEKVQTVEEEKEPPLPPEVPDEVEVEEKEEDIPDEKEVEEVFKETGDSEVESEDEKEDDSSSKDGEKEVLKDDEEELEREKIQDDTPDVEEPKKKGFFSRVFGKKEVSEEEVKEEIEHTKVEQENLEKENQQRDEEKKEEKVEESQGMFSKVFSKVTSKKIDEDDFNTIWSDLEIFLLEINVAFEIVDKIQESLKEAIIGNSFTRFKLSEKIREVLSQEVEEVLKSREGNFLEEIKSQDKPVVIMILGVNGTGKTTTIAKIINYIKKQNLSCVVSASDTFRAAALEQLEEHCKKLDTKLIQHKSGSDPAAVAYDTIEHAKAKGVDVVLIDTAGRMPNNANLMMELVKIKKVVNPHINLFIGDSISGNDLLEQIELFDQGVGISGVILTKVDTDERPGSVVTTAYKTEKPIYFLGHGQTYDDLTIFDAKIVAKNLFDPDE